ncbi:hypothetical protein [Arthrobacter oryzae]|uniref:hypothetical protein n=1 Tax=Arthrobacter oryzae TaxID=409290 RepID=UPI00277F8517|nr:hypothetical protein [Arthrobacter oryzae]MDQ0078223.1 hypothetical protein [Arthrobacter oryzae]
MEEFLLVTRLDKAIADVEWQEVVYEERMAMFSDPLERGQVFEIATQALVKYSMWQFENLERSGAIPRNYRVMHKAEAELLKTAEEIYANPHAKARNDEEYEWDGGIPAPYQIWPKLTFWQVLRRWWKS